MDFMTSMLRRKGWRGSRPLGGLPSFPLAFVLIAVALVAGIWNYLAGERARVEATRQHDIIAQNERLLSTMRDLETGMRGYALVGADDYLEPYRAALGRIDRQLRDLDLLDKARTDEGAGPTHQLRALI